MVECDLEVLVQRKAYRRKALILDWFLVLMVLVGHLKNILRHPRRNQPRHSVEVS